MGGGGRQKFRVLFLFLNSINKFNNTSCNRLCLLICTFYPSHILKAYRELSSTMVGSRVGQGVRTHPLPPEKNIEFLSNTGLNSLGNHKATKLALNVGPLSPCSETPFKWRFARGPMMARL